MQLSFGSAGAASRLLLVLCLSFPPIGVGWSFLQSLSKAANEALPCSVVALGSSARWVDGPAHAGLPRKVWLSRVRTRCEKVLLAELFSCRLRLKAAVDSAAAACQSMRASARDTLVRVCGARFEE